MAVAGVAPSLVQRKIVRVLGERLPPARELPRVGRGKPAGRVLHRRLAEQVAELHRRDSQVRRGRDEGVHQARVACRRLRSALATFRPLVDRQVTDPVREEIKWLGLALGDARDTKVVRDRLRGLLDAQPPENLAGPVRSRLEATYAERRTAAGSRIAEALSSERYFDLLDALDRLVDDPPWTDLAAAPARDVLPALVRKDWRRLRRRMAGVADAADRDHELHEVRKDAKRVRYAAEALAPVWGKDARRLAKAAKRLTSHLGERQDTVMSRPDLRGIAAAADEAGESSLTWGVLLAREEERAAELDRDLADLWGRSSRKKLRRWLGSSA
jgi:CHAD domain-containing protein